MSGERGRIENEFFDATSRLAFERAVRVRRGAAELVLGFAAPNEV